MLQKIQPTTRSLIDFSDPKFHKTVASNAMLIVYYLKMTGLLVTKCAQISGGPAFMCDVAHGNGVFTPRNVKRLAQVLEVTPDVLIAYSRSKHERATYIRNYLQSTGRLDEDCLPLVDEDLYVEERFPTVVEELNQKYGTRRR